MNSVMVILCVGSVLSRVLISCLAVKTISSLYSFDVGVLNVQSINKKVLT